LNSFDKSEFNDHALPMLLEKDKSVRVHLHALDFSYLSTLSRVFAGFFERVAISPTPRRCCIRAKSPSTIKVAGCSFLIRTTTASL